MKLNHIDLQVPDVQATARFFETYFAFELRSSRTSPAIAILAGDGGFVLVLQRRRSGEAFPEGFHVGFHVDSAEEVHAFHARLQAGGFESSAVERNNRGVMLYCRAPGDLTIEVSCPAKR